ncbi:MAG: PEPxxWA-CTERM sorting domain-containing protein [Thermaurantiacus tibetensis]|uniref:PEPxxWA-CTERM sorting domain-containing protein n=1 Tax=Thermaurantiacus tibetensis TaxID=2759035 RepID=UPI001F264E61|nr:PEPxxWA-CTERM sorting domain-containing protein [Thermaurantiacus tibetensis]
MQRTKLASLALAALFAGTPAAASTTVFANNPAPGDAFANPGPTNQGQAVGATGWYYNNVRNNGTVGISTAKPRSGNGSVAFASPSGAAKADIEFLANAVNLGGNFFAAGTLGAFSALSGFGLDWYRDGTSTNPAVQHPVIRVLVDRDGNPLTPGDRFGLVFERAYNALPTLTDQWVTDTVTSATKLWTFGVFGFEADPMGFGSPYIPFGTWQSWLGANFPNAAIVGFSAGVGSGWVGNFTGAVDNVTWTIGGVTSSFNFEVTGGVIPEPATWAMLIAGFGLVGGAMRRRRAALLA